jgi:2-oxoglutarate dehydrogenase E2 component (dihydrolipoamide succinyltransferase)
MAIELKVPSVGESITEVEIGEWLKAKGDSIQKDQPVVTLESEKATVELPAPESGMLGEILKQKGETAKVGEVIGYLEKNGQKIQEPKSKTHATKQDASKPGKETAAAPAQPSPAAKPPPSRSPESPAKEPLVMPSAERVLAEHGLSPEQVRGTGPGGRILKEDVLREVEKGDPRPAPPAPEAAPQTPTSPPPIGQSSISSQGGRQEEVVPMTRLRRTVAERLVQAQQNAALLTTFNEVDMSAVIALRKEYGEAFQQKHNVKLGFMAFFVKASVDALRQFPGVNAEIRGTNIIYHNYCDIGVAIGGGKGLVVPVLRNAERLSFAEIELTIGDFARRAKENKLKVEELQGGTFTISNGGIYGSLLSTPIVNPPQSGVLGMHAIQERPVAREGNVVIRPMMYIALTYDHRLVDGREGVSFLKRIKEVSENPARMLMEI